MDLHRSTRGRFDGHAPHDPPRARGALLGRQAGLPFVVDVRYHGVPFRYVIPDADPTVPAYEQGFIPTDDGAVAVGEPEAASMWYPVDDHPSDKATYSMRITVPDGLTALGNGVLLGSSTRDGWSTWRWAATTPMASYVSTMAVGRWRLDQHLPGGRQTITAVDTALPPSWPTSGSATACPCGCGVTSGSTRASRPTRSGC
jgi:hypothetical protein